MLYPPPPRPRSPCRVLPHLPGREHGGVDI
jgi:hypothetical protein